MRRLLLFALMGMGLSKMYFASFVPPDLKLNAPGFDMLKRKASARNPRWFTHPVRIHSTWTPARAHIDVVRGVPSAENPP